MISVLLVTVLLTIAIYTWQWRSRLAARFKSIPGPKGVPLLGNALQIVSKSSTDLFRLLIDLEREHGKVYKVDIINRCWLFFNAAEDIETIVTSPAFNCKSDDYDMLLEWLGTGLLTSGGNKWFKHRKALTPAFHFKILENFTQVFDEKSTILAKKFLASAGQEITIFPLVKLCTLDVIVETAMGTVSEAQIKQSDYTLAVEAIASIVFIRMFNVVYNVDLFFKLSKYYKPYRRHLKTIKDFTMSIIHTRRQMLGSGSDGQTEDKGELGIKAKKALLDILLQTNIDGRSLTSDEIRQEVDTFMFAGHDTTASAITFLLYSLAKYPEVQEKVYAEILSIIGSDKETPITISTLNDLKYLDLVVKESLRIFPPVPFISRNTIKEIDLAGITIPVDTNVTIGIYNMHHNADYFPEPERFIPERLEAERAAEKLNPYAYVPFSAGGRNCIGQKFAMYEVKSTISKVMRYCRVELIQPEYEVPLKAEMILKPMDGMPLKFYPR